MLEFFQADIQVPVHLLVTCVFTEMIGCFLHSVESDLQGINHGERQAKTCLLYHPCK